VIIRPANEADWHEVYPFFRSIVDAGETYAYPPDTSEETARELWMTQPPSLTVVAELDDVVVGSAKMGPNRPGRGSHVATASFMVSPDHQGDGVGTALGQFVVQWARDNGFHSIQFNAVVETNRGAVHLWQNLGFEILATVPEAFDHSTHGLVGLHVMYLALSENHPRGSDGAHSN
jgi:GNAT superfamily N-acetyltransferase